MSEETKKEIFKWTLNNGILIGSRAWGGSTTFSDYDVVFSEEKFRNIILPNFIKNNIVFSDKGGISDSKCEHIMYNISNFKFFFQENKIINIITYKEDKIPFIKEINSIMLYMAKCPNFSIKLESKQARIRHFELLLHTAFKGTTTGNNIVSPEDDDIPF
ncbi:hypothetical protein GW796_05405 [archaeon]|nr:hypothetical protein [archaeon]NCT58854.1 hypothetical protein [archaeon]